MCEQAPRPGFTASTRERIAALLMLPAAYLYAVMATEEQVMPYLAAFALCFVALNEYLTWGTPHTKESWFWLGCLAVMLAGAVSGRSRVWDDWMTFFFVHLTAVYWAACRSGRLTMGKSSCYVLLDGLNAFLLVPFRYFFLRLRCVISWFSLQKGRRPKFAAIAAVALSLLAAAVLLFMAVGQLSSADAVFQSWVGWLSEKLSFEPDETICVRLLFMFPVSAFVFGILAGLLRKPREALQESGEKLSAALARLRQVPAGLWSAVLPVFCLIYGAFFVLQGQYLFGAFRRSLPDGFTVAQYAREGFFELCRVMMINLVLYWCVTYTGKVRKKSLLQQILTYILLAESMLFAVIALSKLGLYISCFGFTPKRMQSCWLALSLLFGCGCTAFTEATGKKTFALWMYFSAAGLSLLHIF